MFLFNYGHHSVVCLWKWLKSYPNTRMYTHTKTNTKTSPLKRKKKKRKKLFDTHAPWCNHQSRTLKMSTWFHWKMAQRSPQYNPKWLLLKCQREFSLKCQHGDIISKQKYACVSPFHRNNVYFLYSWVSRERWGWCTAWQVRAARRRCTTTNQLVPHWRSSFIFSERGLDSKASQSTGPSWTPKVCTCTEITSCFTSTVEKSSPTHTAAV